MVDDMASRQTDSAPTLTIASFQTSCLSS